MRIVKNANGFGLECETENEAQEIANYLTEIYLKRMVDLEIKKLHKEREAENG